VEITGVTSTATTSVTAAFVGSARHRGSERRCAPLMSEFKGTTVPATGRTDWFATDRAAAPNSTTRKSITSKSITSKPTVQNAPTIQTAAVNVAIVPGPRSWSPPV